MFEREAGLKRITWVASCLRGKKSEGLSGLMIQTSLKREAGLNGVRGLKREADLKRVNG